MADRSDPYSWLERMARAAQEVNYVGDFAYVRDGVLETMQVVHAVDEQGEHERLTTLDGPRREYLRDGGEVRCLLSDENTISVHEAALDQNFSLEFPRRLGRLPELYEARLGPQDRVASRVTQIVEVRPTDEYRFGFRLWADIETGLLLRASVLDSNEAVMEQFSFTRIDYPDTVPAEWWRPQDLAEFSDIPDVAQADSEPREIVAEPDRAEWIIGTLPAGFSQHRHFRRQSAEGASEHLVFSDGIASVSVFVEPIANGTARFVGRSNIGIVNVQSDVVGSHQVTLMGEVPPVTLDAIRASLQPVDAR
ncbi:MAG: MucB/RseB C-terminal domain-containing protein [Pseudomonadota bacterium]|nr:MucB/RseB C-terminal domain-containing protein [Pseudomonadota bacterium]